MSVVKVIKYVGKTTDFKGKSLWEILGTLKNFGVGRIVVRSMFERYPEPTFMKIVKVETSPNEERRRIRVWVEKTFRGKKMPKLTEIYRTSYKTDYRLIHKNEEQKYMACEKAHYFPDVFLPNYVEMPVLMKRFLIAERERKGLEPLKDFNLPLSYNKSPNRVKQIAKDGETPSMEYSMGLGKPDSPSLYEGLQLE